MVNGAKVYVVASSRESADKRVAELNELGKETGGSAHGYVRLKPGSSGEVTETILNSNLASPAMFPTNKPSKT